mmetsp:Transcript_36400/g.88915  ORF Transcript_36400/g.88915 Transcript_36400/m.88915 type:complete len:206 (+) Transcript_36400:470-1087(+)
MMYHLIPGNPATTKHSRCQKRGRVYRRSPNLLATNNFLHSVFKPKDKASRSDSRSNRPQVSYVGPYSCSRLGRRGRHRQQNSPKKRHARRYPRLDGYFPAKEYPRKNGNQLYVEVQQKSTARGGRRHQANRLKRVAQEHPHCQFDSCRPRFATQPAIQFRKRRSHNSSGQSKPQEINSIRRQAILNKVSNHSVLRSPKHCDNVQE